MHIRKGLVLAIEREPCILGAEVRLGKMRFAGMVPVRDRLASLGILADVLMRLDAVTERLRILGRSDLKVKRRIDDDLAVLYAKSIAFRHACTERADDARGQNLSAEFFHAAIIPNPAAEAPRRIAIRYFRLCVAGKCIYSDIMPPACAAPLHQAKHGKSVVKDAQILLFRILRKQRLRHHRLDLRQLRRELAHNSAHGFFI